MISVQRLVMHNERIATLPPEHFQLPASLTSLLATQRTPFSPREPLVRVEAPAGKTPQRVNQQVIAGFQQMPLDLLNGFFQLKLAPVDDEEPEIFQVIALKKEQGTHVVNVMSSVCGPQNYTLKEFCRMLKDPDCSMFV
ncbi:hypothetical protein D9758_005964 [Tetrapyrgos nigripes]|uniref:Uncharacterized protein n=1 Tax=Tetrapyrgos nigripes TaxID=182062 RepID=A0A8H5G2T5_9AGAR|nr:hypothetical protein D9758_005964 [Tetrapyrgos nigripes]